MAIKPQREPLTLVTLTMIWGTVIIEELTLPPGPVLAELNATETAVELSWSPPGGGSGLFFDFEGDDGDWEPTGDWDYTDDYDVSNFVATESEDNTVPPPTAYSGTGMWEPICIQTIPAR